MTKDFITQVWKYLGIYFAILFLVAILILLGGCATRFPLGSCGKYGTVGIDVSYYPPCDFQGVFPPSYLPNHFKK